MSRSALAAVATDCSRNLLPQRKTADPHQRSSLGDLCAPLPLGGNRLAGELEGDICMVVDAAVEAIPQPLGDLPQPLLQLLVAGTAEWGASSDGLFPAGIAGSCPPGKVEERLLRPPSPLASNGPLLRSGFAQASEQPLSILGFDIAGAVDIELDKLDGPDSLLLDSQPAAFLQDDSLLRPPDPLALWLDVLRSGRGELFAIMVLPGEDLSLSIANLRTGEGVLSGVLGTESELRNVEPRTNMSGVSLANFAKHNTDSFLIGYAIVSDEENWLVGCHGYLIPPARGLRLWDRCLLALCELASKRGLRGLGCITTLDHVAASFLRCGFQMRRLNVRPDGSWRRIFWKES